MEKDVKIQTDPKADLLVFGAKYSFQLNLLQCASVINTKLNWWFGLQENNIISVYECSHNLNWCIFNITNTLKWTWWMVCTCTTTMCNASWVILNMVATREHLIIEWIWNNLCWYKTCLNRNWSELVSWFSLT